jgi:DNA damage-binding protein 1
MVFRTPVVLGPIVDFAMLDLERNGQGAMLTCSGSYKDGSLRVVRNGIGVREEASIELPGIQGVWSLSDDASAESVDAVVPGEEAHRLLVQTFATETRVLALEPDDDQDAGGEGGGGALQLAECEVAGFDANQRTLHCANLAGGLLLQVTQASCRLVDAKSMQLVDEWRLPAAAATAAAGSPAPKLTVASSNPTQVLVGAGKTLVLLTLQQQQRKLQLHKQVVMDEEISCVDITPVSVAFLYFGALTCCARACRGSLGAYCSRFVVHCVLFLCS